MPHLLKDCQKEPELHLLKDCQKKPEPHLLKDFQKEPEPDLLKIVPRRCGGLVVRVSASRSPVPGSILGPGGGLPTVWSEGRQITLILY